MIEPTLITGAARSGTSLVAGIINICGAFGGKLASGNHYNPKGMYENREIVDKITKPYLKELGCDPMGQYPLPDVHKMQVKQDIASQFYHIMDLHGWDGETPLFYKDAKTCLFWPVWRYAFPNAKWVIVRRQDKDIVNSCLKTGFMRAFNDIEGWQWWVDQHKQRFREMQEAGLDLMQIWPEKMVAGDYTQIEQVIQWLGLEWKDQEVKDFIEPKLYKSEQKEAVNA